MSLKSILPVHALLIWLALIPAASATGYYVYKQPDGTNLFTDKRMPKDEYTLIATIGRPTATSSCVGQTAASLEGRAKSHSTVIEQYSKMYGIDAHLIKAIIMVESCFDRYAVSRVGAQGLMQLMPATATKMGVYNVFSANDNIRGGTGYFREMLETFDYDVELALAAYNAGPGAVQKYQGIPPYKETQNYVKKVLQYYNRYAQAGS